jgi:hypothetical protein
MSITAWPLRMSWDTNWVPMKWPCGPLEIARRSKSQRVNREAKETLEAWAMPGALELLKGTPVNCLIVDWAGGESQDSAQQKALKPILEAGRRLGINFVGKIAAKADVRAAVEAGREAGLSAVMLEGLAAQPSEFPAISQFPREKVMWEATSPIFSSTDNLWPGLGLDTMKGDVAIAGPTGIPWVNSNAWFSLLAQELAAGKELWLDFDPPDSSTVAHPADYCLAVADCRAYGSRWIISLDDKLRAAILQRNSQALGVWSELCEMLAFFDAHKEWEAFQPQGVLAVVSDFRGDNAFLSGEVLNLLNRRQVQFRVVARSRMSSASTQGLQAILWMDKETPSDEQRSKLLAFAQRGGLAIAAEYWGPREARPIKKDPSLHYNVYRIGQGQIAVAEEGFSDPYQVAVDTHLLVSHRHDLVRLYNPDATNCHWSISPDHAQRLVQVINYSANPADYVTVWVNDGRVSSARLFRPETSVPPTLQGVAAKPGTDFYLPTFTVYCALEFERTK